MKVQLPLGGLMCAYVDPFLTEVHPCEGRLFVHLNETFTLNRRSAPPLA